MAEYNFAVFEEEKNCEQCKDLEQFKNVGFPKEIKKCHDILVKKANKKAKKLATEDFGKNSFTWEELFMHHFSKVFAEMVKKNKSDIFEKYIETCYKKDYADGYICCYHAECR
jgi:hypothetical protein